MAFGSYLFVGKFCGTKVAIVDIAEKAIFRCAFLAVIDSRRQRWYIFVR
jgi:hypothetical protein